LSTVLDLPAPKPASALPPEVARPLPTARPRLTPVRAPYPPATRNQERAQVWVRITLFVVVVALLVFCIALPLPGTRREAAQAERRLTEVRLVLDELRAVLADYRADHGTWPGQGLHGAEAPELFADQIALPTAPDGQILVTPGAQTGGVRGPYRDGGVPANPINGLATVRFLSATEPWPAEADGTTGWIYRPSTGEVRANAPGRVHPAAPRSYDL
jgi:hypothetical protein